MNVLVDTCVWSSALRRRTTTSRDRPVVDELGELIREKRVVMIGAVRQEILSGIRDDALFASIRDRLRAFPDLVPGESDYERAASCFNSCRKRGIQGSNTDFLVCAMALGHGLSVFTTDEDFMMFRDGLGVTLHSPR